MVINRLMGAARDNIEAALIATGPAEKIAPQVCKIESILVFYTCKKSFDWT